MNDTGFALTVDESQDVVIKNEAFFPDLSLKARGFNSEVHHLTQ